MQYDHLPGDRNTAGSRQTIDIHTACQTLGGKVYPVSTGGEIAADQGSQFPSVKVIYFQTQGSLHRKFKGYYRTPGAFHRGGAPTEGIRIVLE